jgi:hypothetical protein
MIFPTKFLPSIFISYAHKDSTEFVQRLHFSLKMYCDVYYDINLEAGEFPPQLENEIKRRNIFLYVVSPYALESPWCKREFEIALQTKSKIMLAQFLKGEIRSNWLENLISEYLYSDFREDFDIGFQKITNMILGQPFSSWEYRYKQKDDKILEALSQGYLPGVIAKEVVDWVITDKLWLSASSYINSTYQNSTLQVGSPKTIGGVWRKCIVGMEYAKQENDVLSFKLFEDTKQIIENSNMQITAIRDDDNLRAGQCAFSIIEQVKTHIRNKFVGMRDTIGLWAVDKYFDFDVAEKLRELIIIYSRRNRYLY